MQFRGRNVTKAFPMRLIKRSRGFVPAKGLRVASTSFPQLRAALSTIARGGDSECVGGRAVANRS